MHVENEYHGDSLGNGLTVESITKVEKLIDVVESRYGGVVKFLTFGQVAQYLV